MPSLSPHDTYRKLEELTAGADFIYNFTCQIAMGLGFVVETPLFPRLALEAYSRKNLGLAPLSGDAEHFNAARGGPQGDYSELMQEKIANVVDCLERFPRSKRAVIAICNNPLASHDSDGDAKCVREVHFRLDESNTLHASVFFRAHAAAIFPKNIHFLGSLMAEVAGRLKAKPRLGELFFMTTVLAGTRAH